MALPPWLPLFLRVWIIGACAYMMACGVLSIMENKGIATIDEVFLGLYVLLFATLIVAYESTRFCSESSPAEVIERVYKRNFGFMLKAQTRGMFLIFVGFMVLGLAEKPNMVLVMGCGVVTITTGIVFICLTCKDPDLFTDKPAQKPQEPYVPPNSETHPGAPAKWEP